MKAQCHKCLYSWDFRGNLAMATCPSCGSKVKVYGELHAPEKADASLSDHKEKAK